MLKPLRRRAIWAGRITAGAVLAGLAVYLVRVGLDTADKLASSVSLVVAVAALLAPYLLPARTPPEDEIPAVAEPAAPTAPPPSQTHPTVTIHGDAQGFQIVHRGRAKMKNNFRS